MQFVEIKYLIMWCPYKELFKKIPGERYYPKYVTVTKGVCRTMVPVKQNHLRRNKVDSLEIKHFYNEIILIRG